MQAYLRNQAAMWHATWLGSQVVAVKGRDGEVRVMSNICRHRYTVLTSGERQVPGQPDHVPLPRVGLWSGRAVAGRAIYGWRGGISKADNALRIFRHEVWHGYVFVNLRQCGTAGGRRHRSLSRLWRHIGSKT